MTGNAGPRPPAVFTIDAGFPFSEALANGLLTRLGTGPDLARVTLLVPTRRAVRAMRDAFLRQTDGVPLLLPVIRPIGDVDEDDLAATEAVTFAASDSDTALTDLPPAVPGLTRQFRLAKLIAAWGSGTGQPEIGAAQALDLAAELARFIDQIQTEQLDPAGLATLVPAEFAGHWQHTLAFLRLVTAEWPRLLAADGMVDPAARRNALLLALATQWETRPPADPVIAAGSTGTIPASATLLRVVSRLPQGAVVLPGLDRHLDDESWGLLDQTHPQFGMRHLLERIGIARSEVMPWPSTTPVRAPLSRIALISEVMRPAATSERWRDVTIAPDALDGVTRVTSPTPREEAGVIALAMREALETPGKTVALVTPDRALAHRVAAALLRWGILVDDSAGTPLMETVPGVFLRLTATMIAVDLAPIALLATLKHPLAAGGMALAGFREMARRLERKTLRGLRPAPGFAGLRRALPPAADDLAEFVARLEQIAQPFAGLRGRVTGIGDLVRAHAAFAESLAATDSEAGAVRLWQGDAGEALAILLRGAVEGEAHLPPLTLAAYPGVLDTLLRGQVVRPRYGAHPRASIWGPLEARLQQADCLILGGLNEGGWPPDPQPDPWLSRPMRGAFGLPQPERRIGLAAHDFAQAAGAAELLLTRAEKVDGTPTVPSRWLLRLETLAGPPRDEERDRAERYRAWQARLDEVAERTPAIAPPAPRPPLAARPDRLSVTEIETLLRNPYGVYARRVLGLRRLDDIDQSPGAADRGNFLHKVLRDFVKQFPTDLLPDAAAHLRMIGQRHFEVYADRPGVWAFWWPAFERMSDWFVAVEQAHRRQARPLAQEATGHIILTELARPVTIHARADRIDQDGESLWIIDYKSGQASGQTKVDSGLAPQLPLEALIAENGGFVSFGVPAHPVVGLEYWTLGGARSTGARKSIKPRPVDYTRAQLLRLLRHFEQTESAYLARPRPRHAPEFDDYAHLARVAEWSVEGEE